jgi:hypothetical protein
VDTIPGNTFSLVNFAPIIQTYIAQSGTRVTTLAVTLPAITQIYVLVNNTNQTGYNVTFQNQGSSQTPFVLQAGQIVTVLSDGLNLYPLTSSTTGSFLTANGTAALPAYSFNSDVHTGMYLVGNNILGLSANSTDIVRIDNSNTSAPLVTVAATISAQILTADSATITGAVAAGSAVITGAVAAGSAAITGAVTADSATLTNALNAGSANITGTLTAGLITGGSF